MASGASTPAAGTLPRTRRTSWRARTREGRFALALLAPSVVVVFGIVIYPILRTLYTSLYRVDTPFPGHFPFIGLRNYTFAVAQPEFWSAVERTAYFTIVSTGLELLLGIGVALLLYAPLRGRWLFRTIVVLPWALPTIVNGAMWKYFFNAQYGVVNALFTQLGLQSSYHAWLSSPFGALNIVILADVWKNTSLVAFFLLAGLTTIPRDLYEAAAVDGATRWRQLWHIAVPALRPVIYFVLTISIITSMQLFTQPFIMTNGGPLNATLSIVQLLYRHAFVQLEFGYGSAIATVLLVLLVALALINKRVHDLVVQ